MTPSRDPSETPVMQQYRRYKSQYADTLLFFRMGDFYELFYDDAIEAARLLSLTLTSRQKGENAIPMAGVPHHAAEGYIRRLIEAGRRVAICEQMQDPREAKGLVERDVVRVISPGALTEDSLLEAKAPNYLAALCPAGDQTGIAWVDFSTGLFQVEDLPTPKLLDELARIAPAECLMPQSAANDDNPVARIVRHDITTLLTPRPDWTFNREGALRSLQEHFGVQTLEGFGCAGLGPSLSAAGAALAYLQETQKVPLGHLRRLTPVQDSGRLLMDRPTRLSLELTRTLRDGKRQGTLLHVLDRTLTPMGGRLLAEWIHAPLCSPEPIRARLAAVQDLAQDPALRRRVSDALRSVYDIERLSARISVGRASPRDLLALKNSLAQLPAIKDALASAQAPLLLDICARIDPVQEARDAIAAALSSDPPLLPRDGGVFRDGYNQELDELRAIQRDGKGWIARFQAQEAERAGIPSLKVGFNKVFGYYIEISNAHASRVPADYLRKQTLTNAERYITPQLKEYETKVLTAGERACQIELDLFLQLRAAIAAHTPRFQATAAAIAELDALTSLAAVAVEHGYCRPEIRDEPCLDIRDGRHPVIERILGRDFVPNDIVMNEGARMLIITGPNMAGKSTYIRQAALLVLMAQMGSFVPAKSAVIGVADRIFTRVGAADEIARGQST
ncbi:MAG TPA: DNA mismatch repair protein MutS, partial [Candidatus Brocadiia bacterium]|nr:DNA mismatch repair protein MutS [Candidatus Brocadiia bacterium]